MALQNPNPGNSHFRFVVLCVLGLSALSGVVLIGLTLFGIALTPDDKWQHLTPTIEVFKQAFVGSTAALFGLLGGRALR